MQPTVTLDRTLLAHSLPLRWFTDEALIARLPSPLTLSSTTALPPMTRSHLPSLLDTVVTNLLYLARHMKLDQTPPEMQGHEKNIFLAWRVKIALWAKEIREHKQPTDLTDEACRELAKTLSAYSLLRGEDLGTLSRYILSLPLKSSPAYWLGRAIVSPVPVTVQCQDRSLKVDSLWVASSPYLSTFFDLQNPTVSSEFNADDHKLCGGWSDVDPEYLNLNRNSAFFQWSHHVASIQLSGLVSKLKGLDLSKEWERNHALEIYKILSQTNVSSKELSTAVQETLLIQPPAVVEAFIDSALDLPKVEIDLDLEKCLVTNTLLSAPPSLLRKLNRFCTFSLCAEAMNSKVFLSEVAFLKLVQLPLVFKKLAISLPPPTISRDWSFLASLHRLETLHVEQTFSNPTGLIQNLPPSLKELSLGETNITSEHLDKLPRGIQTLNLTGCKHIKDYSFLLNLPFLALLIIQETDLPDDFAEQLKKRGIRIARLIS